MKKNYESIRIFKNPFLESLTHVHPIIPLVMWTPIIGYFQYLNYLKGHSVSMNLLVAFMGLVVWTLMEYVLHRYVFHFNGQSRLAKRFVFLFHGLHHDDPNDPTRLVMPPVPAILISTPLYFMFRALLGPVYIEQFFSWFMIGYLCYDYIHYATHHFPMTSKVGKYLKKHHIMHHNVCHDKKYGVSSPLWDIVFNTHKSDKRK